MPATAASQARTRRASARATRGGSAALPVLVVERLRWDRIGRLALLCVLLALVYLYLSAGARILSTYKQARADRAAVAALAREHTLLEQRRQLLGRQATVEAEARRLGMAHRGEQQYVVSGLPRN